MDNSESYSTGTFIRAIKHKNNILFFPNSKKLNKINDNVFSSNNTNKSDNFQSFEAKKHFNENISSNKNLNKNKLSKGKNSFLDFSSSDNNNNNNIFQNPNHKKIVNINKSCKDNRYQEIMIKKKDFSINKKAMMSQTNFYSVLEIKKDSNDLNQLIKFDKQSDNQILNNIKNVNIFYKNNNNNINDDTNLLYHNLENNITSNPFSIDLNSQFNKNFENSSKIQKTNKNSNLSDHSYLNKYFLEKRRFNLLNKSKISTNFASNNQNDFKYLDISNPNKNLICCNSIKIEGNKDIDDYFYDTFNGFNKFMYGNNSYITKKNFLDVNHKRNVSINSAILKNPETKSLARVHKLFNCLREKQKKIENIVEPFIFRNKKIPNKNNFSSNNIIQRQKNEFSNITEYDKMNPDFFKINIYNSNDIVKLEDINSNSKNKLINHDKKVYLNKNDKKVFSLTTNKFNPINITSINSKDKFAKTINKFHKTKLKDQAKIIKNSKNDKNDKNNKNTLVNKKEKYIKFMHNTDNNQTTVFENKKKKKTFPFRRRNFSEIITLKKSSCFYYLLNDEGEDLNNYSFVNNYKINKFDNEVLLGVNKNTGYNSKNNEAYVSEYYNLEEYQDNNNKEFNIRNKLMSDEYLTSKSCITNRNTNKLFEDYLLISNNYDINNSHKADKYHSAFKSSEKKSTSNFSSSTNWMINQQKDSNYFKEPNQKINKFYDIKIDDRNIPQKKEAIVNVNLFEHKYLDNIKFNYMIKNFQSFKNYIKRPNEIIKPEIYISIPQKIISNDGKVNILTKLKNPTLKKEIQRKKIF